MTRGEWSYVMHITSESVRYNVTCTEVSAVMSCIFVCYYFTVRNPSRYNVICTEEWSLVGPEKIPEIRG